MLLPAAAGAATASCPGAFVTFLLNGEKNIFFMRSNFAFPWGFISEVGCLCERAFFEVHRET